MATSVPEQTRDTRPQRADQTCTSAPPLFVNGLFRLMERVIHVVCSRERIPHLARAADIFLAAMIQQHSVWETLEKIDIGPPKNE